MSAAGYVHPRVHALTVMITSHKKIILEQGVSPEMSEQGLQERCIHPSPSYTFHPYGLPFSGFTDLYWAEKGLMARSMNMLLKIYSPVPCVYKNYHKIVIYPPDWKIFLHYFSC